MDNLRNELTRQTRIYKGFLEDWINVKATKNAYDLTKWFYELTMFMIYHFYTEEVYLKSVDDKEHIKAHHRLLKKMFSVLLNQGSTYPVLGIDDFIKEYESHRKYLDEMCDYQLPNDSKAYFRPSDSHGGFLVIALKMGYYSVAFGALTHDVAGNYVLDPGIFDKGWIKFVDLRRWGYLTHDAVEVSTDVNELEVSHGLTKSYFIINEDGISEFSVDQFVLEDQSSKYIYQLERLLKNEDLLALFNSDLIDYFVVSSTSYIDAYFESYLDNRLE